MLARSWRAQRVVTLLSEDVLMQRLVGAITVDMSIVWQRIGSAVTPELDEAGISVGFTRSGPLLRRRGKSHLQEILEKNQVRWLWQHGESWFLDLDGLKKEFDWLRQENWAVGVAQVSAILSAPSGHVRF